MKIRVGHLYPDYLNIYADRGNIAVLAERAARAATSSRSTPIGSATRPGRDRPLLRRRRPGSRAGARRRRPRGKADALRDAVDGGAAFLAVCGGYQLLGRFYRDVAGDELPGHRPPPARTPSPASAG